MEFKLLIVDDEPAVTATLGAVFQDQGYRILRAGSGDEALALCDQEPVDAVVLVHPAINSPQVITHDKI